MSNIDPSTHTPLSRELMAKVFAWNLCPFEDEAFSQEDTRNVCMRVDKAWCRLIQGDPNLWRNIFIDNFSDLSVVSKSIRWSKAMEIHLYVDLLDPVHIPSTLPVSSRFAYFLSNLFVDIRPALPRCFRITLRSENVAGSTLFLRHLSAVQCPKLQDLRLHLFPPVDFTTVNPPLPVLLGGSAPALTSLAIRHSFLFWATPLLYQSVQELWLTSIPVDLGLSWPQLQGALEILPALTHLHLLRVECEYSNRGADRILSTSCYLPRVTHLNIAIHHQSAIYIACALQLPALRVLQLEAFGDTFLGATTNLFFRQVLHASLTISPSDKPTLAEALGCFPCVQELDIRGCNDDVVDLFRQLVLCSKMLCQALERIHCPRELSRLQLRDFLVGRRATVLHTACRLTCPSPADSADSNLTYEHSVFNGRLTKKLSNVQDLFAVVDA
jgi:hypothetical protein